MKFPEPLRFATLSIFTAFAASACVDDISSSDDELGEDSTTGADGSEDSSEDSSEGSSESGDGSTLYDPARIHEFHFVLSDAALDQIRADADASGFDTNHVDTYVEGDLEIDGVVYPQIGLRVKGNSSRSMSVGDYLPFKLDMNRFVMGQKIDGQTKISLHNNASDASFMHDYTSYAAWRRAGVAASRTGWADVYLNGEFLGFYTLVEQVGDDMLARTYADGDRARYKPEPPAGWLTYEGDMIDAYENLDIESEGEGTHAAFLDFVRAIDQQPVSEWSGVFDVESVLLYFAGNVALGNWDTYVAMGHNYYLYEGEVGRIAMLPWDMNLSQGTLTGICPGDAGGFGGGGGNMPPPPMGGGFPSMGDPVLHDRLLADPDAFAQYRALLVELIENAASPAMIGADIDAVEGLLGERVDAVALQQVRDNLSQRETTILSMIETTATCVE